MSSELKQQVNKLKEQSIQTQLLSQGRPSLFLTPKEAAAISTEAILDAAVDGLISLNQYDSRFSEYLNSLFHSSSASLQRELKTKEENKTLDKQINKFLILLSPYLLEPDAHKTIEYLIRRYRINDLNVDALISCCIPRHDSKIFARIIQLCSIEKNSKWSFLEGAKQSGSPILRLKIVKQCSKDVSLLETICDTVESIVSTAFSSSIKSLGITGVDSILSFWTAVVIELLEMYPSGDSHLRILLPILFKAMSSRHTVSSGNEHPANQFRRCSSMILVQISRKIPTLSAPLKNAIFNSFVSAFNIVHDDDELLDPQSRKISNELLASLVIISQHQVLKLSGENLALLLIGQSDNVEVKAIDALIRLKPVLEISCFIVAVVSALCFILVDEAQQIIEYEQVLHILQLFLNRGLLESTMVNHALSIIINAFKSELHGENNVNYKQVKGFLKAVSQRFPDDFDATFQSALLEARSQSISVNGIQSLLVDVLSDSHYRLPTENGLNLLLSLKHPSLPIRIKAMIDFSKMDINENSDTEGYSGLCQAVISCLEERDVRMVENAWTGATLDKLVLISQGNYSVDIVNLVEATIKYWTVQQGEFNAQKVLLKLLEALLSNGVLDIIVDQRPNQSSSNIDWLTIFLISSIFNPNPNEEMQGIAYKICFKLRDHVLLFKSLKKSAKSAAVAITSSVIASTENSESWCEIIERLSTSITEFKENYSRDSLANFFFYVLSDILDNKRPEIEKVYPQLASILVSLAIRYLDSDSSKTCTAILMKPLLQLLSRLPQTIADEALTENSTQNLLLGLSPEDLKVKLLLALLSRDTGFEYLGLVIDSCFRNTFTSTAIKILLSRDSDDKYVESASFENLVSVKCRAKASVLHILASYFDAWSSLSEEELISKSNLLALKYILPILVNACVHRLSILREAGLAVAIKLSNIKLAKHHSKLVEGNSGVKVGDLLTLCKYLSDKASLIAVDHDACNFIALDLQNSRQGVNSSLYSVLLWSSCVYSLSSPGITRSSLQLCISEPLCNTWSIIKQLFTSDIGSQRMVTYEDISSLAKCISTYLSKLNTASGLELEIIQTALSDKVLSATKSSSLWFSSLREQLLLALYDGRIMIIGDYGIEVISSAYLSLISELLRHPGDKLVVNALSALPVSFQLIYETIKMHITEFNSVLDQNSGDSNTFDNEESEIVGGLSVLIERITTLVQVSSNVLSSNANKISLNTDDLIVLGQIGATLMSAFRRLNKNNDRLKTIFNLEYSTSVLLDLVGVSLSYFFKSAKNHVTPSKKKSSRTKSKIQLNDDSYSFENITADIETLLICLSSAKSVYLQTSALNVMKILVSASPDPNIIESCLELFSDLLSTTSVASNIYSSREDLIRNIFSSFTRLSINPIEGSSSTKLLESLDILQPFCLHFGSISPSRRFELIRIAMTSIGVPSSIPTLTCILLAHSIVSFESDSLAQNEKEEVSSMIILSRAAQKRAHRMMMTTKSEELFRQCVDIGTSAVSVPDAIVSADTQMCNLVLQIKFVQYLFRKSVLAAIDGLDNDSIDSENDVFISKTFSGVALSIHPSKSLNYVATLYHKKSSNDNNDNSLQSSISLGLLTLEYIVECLQSKSFHRSILQLIDSSHLNLNEYLQEFSEEILELVSLSTRIQLMSGPKGQKSRLPIQLGDEITYINALSLGKTIEHQSLEILQSIQRLLDAPVFVQVIEELILHENQVIRHRALQVLSIRLESLGQDKKSLKNEVPLFLDLITKLRLSIKETIPAIDSCLRDHGSSLLEIPQLGLCQSALLCIDSVARCLTHENSTSEWFEATLQTFSEISSLAENVNGLILSTSERYVQSTPKKTKHSAKSKVVHVAYEEAKKSGSYAGLVKLAGSVFLSCGTLASVLGPRSLPYLQSTVSSMLSSIEYNVKELAEDIETNSSSLRRAQVLLLRSIITSLTTLIRAIPQFLHPYIDQILIVTLPIQSLSGAILPTEVTAINNDLDLCYEAIITKLSNRLLVPAVMKAAASTDPQIFSIGHASSARFIRFLHSLWNNMPRTVIAANSANLCMLATLAMDYRRVYGDQSADSDTVDEIAVLGVVDLCMKFTEAELKSFVVKLFDWKDVHLQSTGESFDSSDQDITKVKQWRALSRSVCFYHFVTGLATKLRVIFLPTMSNIWSNAAHSLSQMYSINSALSNSFAGVVEQSGKKKKRKSEQSDSITSPDVKNKEIVIELVLRAKYILRSVRICALHDSGQQLVDEAHFNAMMPPVVAILGMEELFYENTLNFTSFCEEEVIPCLSALAIAVANDLQWKPLNHKILMHLRDKRKAVRIIALKALKTMFSDVGEYMLLLPECLPFLSELMEDDDSEVTHLTHVVIRAIEDISGEKLDGYLQ